MRKSRYSETQITSAIEASESGKKVKDICNELGISEATFYSWKKKYTCLLSEEGKKIKELEDKLTLLSREINMLTTDKEILQSIISHFFTTSDKRQAVNFIQDKFKIGTRRSCRLLDISRSVYHYSAHCENHSR